MKSIIVVPLRLSPRSPGCKEAREAVERAAPFPPPPHGSIVIEVPIRYDLDN